MKKFFLLLICTCSFLLSKSQTPKLYLQFVSHNEETDIPAYNQNNHTYDAWHDSVKHIADVIIARNAKWDFQSDWKFLDGALKYDDESNATSFENIVKWMDDQPQIECDAHAHETNYNYADVAKLLDSLGVPDNKIVGGFLYDTIINGHDWQDLETGIYGSHFPSFFWQPDVLWGAGTPNHATGDVSEYGAWKPQSMTGFFSHDDSKHLLYIGNGCANLLDTFAHSEDTVYRSIKQIVDAIQSHAVPDTGFYVARIMMNVRDFTSHNFRQKISVLLDSLQPMVDADEIEWKTLSECKDLWFSSYNKSFQFGCDEVAAGVGSTGGIKGAHISPNPSSGPIHIDLSSVQNYGTAQLQVADFSGRVVIHINNYSVNDPISLEQLMPGIYLVKIITHDSTYLATMIKQ